MRARAPTGQQQQQQEQEEESAPRYIRSNSTSPPSGLSSLARKQPRYNREVNSVLFDCCGALSPLPPASLHTQSVYVCMIPLCFPRRGNWVSDAAWGELKSDGGKIKESSPGSTPSGRRGLALDWAVYSICVACFRIFAVRVSCGGDGTMRGCFWLLTGGGVCWDVGQSGVDD